jgi:cell division protein FtsN
VASRDYVKRGGGPNKRPAPKKSPKRLPIRSGLIAIAAVSLFGYGLTFLSQTPQPEPTVKTQLKPIAKPSVNAKKEKTLPPPPTQEWDYQKTLPNKEIEVTAKALNVSDIPYVMQCGAYKTMRQAEERKANIAFQGMSSKIRKKEDSSWYRVVLGPYTFKREAERDKHKLQRAKIEPCAIWKDNQ